MRFFAALFLAAMSAAHAADDPKQRQDLTAVIALQGKPCGEVVSYVAQADNDFVATCKDGNRYRVYVKDGRVVVEKK
jgi:glucose-6-phosphate 1-dehydrogenase